MFTEKLKRMMILEEGQRNQPYDDSTGKRVRAPYGNITIGIGRNLDANPLSTDIIERIFQEDAEWALETATRSVNNFTKLSENQQLGILNMIFNLGATKFNLFCNMIEAIEANNFDKAVTDLKDSQYFRSHMPRVERISRMLKDEFPYL